MPNNENESIIAKIGEVGIFGKAHTPHDPMKKAKYIKFSWVPDLPDHRDHIYETLNEAKSVETLANVDLRSKCSPVEDQSTLGSCTANASAGALEFLEIKNNVKFYDVSRLFIYYNTRAIEGTTKYDAGGTLRDSVKAMNKQGACSETLWPYKISKFATKPTQNCYDDAIKHTISSYQRITTFDGMKQCLSDGYPFIFGFTVYSSFMSAAVAKTGVANMPGKNESVLGGHAVLCCGMVESDQRFIIRNSWGVGWGQKGHFTMPYAYLTTTNLADDFWTIRKEN